MSEHPRTREIPTESVRVGDRVFMAGWVERVTSVTWIGFDRYTHCPVFRVVTDWTERHGLGPWEIGNYGRPVRVVDEPEGG